MKILIQLLILSITISYSQISINRDTVFTAEINTDAARKSISFTQTGNKTAIIDSFEIDQSFRKVTDSSRTGVNIKGSTSFGACSYFDLILSNGLIRINKCPVTLAQNQTINLNLLVIYNYPVGSPVPKRSSAAQYDTVVVPINLYYSTNGVINTTRFYIKGLYQIIAYGIKEHKNSETSFIEKYYGVNGKTYLKSKRYNSHHLTLRSHVSVR